MGKLGRRRFFCLISTFTFTGQSWFDLLFFIWFCLKRKFGCLWSFSEQRESEVTARFLSNWCLFLCCPVSLSCQVIWSGLVIGQLVSSSLCLCNITLALSCHPRPYTTGHLINKHQQSTSSWLLSQTNYNDGISGIFYST